MASTAYSNASPIRLRMAWGPSPTACLFQFAAFPLASVLSLSNYPEIRKVLRPLAGNDAQMACHKFLLASRQFQDAPRVASSNKHPGLQDDHGLLLREGNRAANKISSFPTAIPFNAVRKRSSTADGGQPFEQAAVECAAVLKVAKPASNADGACREFPGFELVFTARGLRVRGRSSDRKVLSLCAGPPSRYRLCFLCRRSRHIRFRLSTANSFDLYRQCNPGRRNE